MYNQTGKDTVVINELEHDKTYGMICMASKDSSQTAHLGGLHIWAAVQVDLQESLQVILLLLFINIYPIYNKT